MPYKSDRQRRYFHAAEKRGEISHKTVAEFDRASKGANYRDSRKKASMTGKAGRMRKGQYPMKDHYMGV